jgi:hypothetical protein
MNGDDLNTFQEKNWDWLITKFLKAHEDDWNIFVDEEYQKKEPDEDTWRDR